MDRGNTAMLDSRDEVARLERDNQEILAAGLCPQHPAYWRGRRGLTTWGPDGLTYAVEHGDESVARWMGYEVGEEENVTREDSNEPHLYVYWHGTARTARNTYAAQFTLEAFE